MLLATVELSPLSFQLPRCFAAFPEAGRTTIKCWDQTTIYNIANFCTPDRSGRFTSSLDPFNTLESTALFAKTGPKRQNVVCCGDFLEHQALPAVVQARPRLILTLWMDWNDVWSLQEPMQGRITDSLLQNMVQRVKFNGFSL